MERITKYDTVCKCYKVKPGAQDGRNLVKELGIYEDIHEKEIKKARNITDIRDLYFTKGANLDPYWENLGKPKTERSGWIPVTERLPEDGEYVLMDFERNAYVDGHDGPVRKRDIGVGYQFDGFWHVDGCSKVVCLAWQPLPDAYEGEE